KLEIEEGQETPWEIYTRIYKEKVGPEIFVVLQWDANCLNTFIKYVLKKHGNPIRVQILDEAELWFKHKSRIPEVINEFLFKVRSHKGYILVTDKENMEMLQVPHHELKSQVDGCIIHFEIVNENGTKKVSMQILELWQKSVAYNEIRRVIFLPW